VVAIKLLREIERAKHLLYKRSSGITNVAADHPTVAAVDFVFQGYFILRD
jgi:hypothetical protein